MYNYDKMIAITNRKLCNNDYYEQIEKICSLRPKALIIREKDLSKDEYRQLAKKVMSICRKYNVDCFLHSYPHMARELGCDNIHMSIPGLRETIKKAAENVKASDLVEEGKITGFKSVSVSCHSGEDVKEAEMAGATQIILGNIFETQCKEGLAGKGLDFLREICDSTSLPVYAIGGITPDNLTSVLQAHGAGGCMMSGFMKL